MSVTKRNGRREPVDLNKIVRAVQRNCDGLHAVDPMRVATRTISGLYDGATTRELDELSIRTAALLTAEEPEYGRLAARLLADYIDKEVAGQEIHAFSQSMLRGHEVGLINDRLLGFVQANARKFNDAHRRLARPALRLLRPAHAVRPLPAAPPAHAQGHRDAAAVLPAHRLRAERGRARGAGAVPAHGATWTTCPVSPTLFNAGTTHEQLSSLLPARLAAGFAGIDLPELRRHRPAVASSAAASASASPACVRAAR